MESCDTCVYTRACLQAGSTGVSSRVVNSSADERTALVMTSEKGKLEEDDSSSSATTTHMRIIGKGEDIQVEVRDQ